VPLTIGGGLLRETFATVRECGAGRDECVVYWAGPRTDPSLVDRVFHPAHSAAPGYYEIDAGWLNQIWFELHEHRIAIRVQVHTHGGPAFHSTLDDTFPLLQTAGFLSLVLPRFGKGDVGFDGAYLSQLRAGGGWRQLDPKATFSVQ